VAEAAEQPDARVAQPLQEWPVEQAELQEPQVFQPQAAVQLQAALEVVA
jgi:hypothetical protein